ncbi:Serine/threonine-protein kinase tnni3k [Entophlyctis luteolus]|nr:Serine/threonine-protein kinase tnni3k [Entophlyctis luteolus]
MRLWRRLTVYCNCATDWRRFASGPPNKQQKAFFARVATANTWPVCRQHGFYIQVFQFAAVPWTGSNTDKDLQLVIEHVLKVERADILAKVESEINRKKEITKQAADAVLLMPRWKTWEGEFLASSKFSNIDQASNPLPVARPGWNVIRKDELSHWSQEHIGSGSFGVHQARWGTTKVAVKRVADVLHNKKVRAAVELDVETWSCLNHPNVVCLFRACIDTDLLFFVMKYFHLSSLSRYLHSHSEIHHSQLVKWMLDVCKGLHQIHKEGIIHSDLKLSGDI